jgi:uncharacterized protein (TIGR00290 family)
VTRAAAEPIVLCSSGGKDSLLALHELRRAETLRVADLLTTMTGESARVSMHGVRIELLRRQAAALGLPLTVVEIRAGASNADYEAAMGGALERYRERGIRKVAFGDLFLSEIREYRERQLREAGMEAVFPVWGRDTAELAEEFVGLGFRAVTCCVDPRRLDESFVGRSFDAEFLADLPAGVDPCGENGEFHTFVCDGPNFAEPISFDVDETVLRDSFLFCDLVSNDPATTSGGAARGVATTNS